jgi:hypothetical protein
MLAASAETNRIQTGFNLHHPHLHVIAVRIDHLDALEDLALRALKRRVKLEQCGEVTLAVGGVGVQFRVGV